MMDPGPEDDLPSVVRRIPAVPVSASLDMAVTATDAEARDAADPDSTDTVDDPFTDAEVADSRVTVPLSACADDDGSTGVVATRMEP